MANAPTPSAAASRYWVVPVSRAILALVAAAVITFTARHSTELGLLVFGSFAVLSGLLMVVLAGRTPTGGAGRPLSALQGAVGIVGGILALIFHGGGLGFFLYLVSVWAAVTGFLELYSGVRARRMGPFARDWIFVGSATAILSLAFLLLPPHPIVSVGLLGAYFVLLGVFLAIAALSLKWAQTDARTSVAASAKESDFT